MQARPQADAALRQQVRQLLQGWNLTDPNPGAYGAALQRMAKASPLFAAPVEEAYPTEPDRIAAMGLELDVIDLPVLEAVDRVVIEGRVMRLLESLEEMPTTEHGGCPPVGAGRDPGGRAPARHPGSPRLQDSRSPGVAARAAVAEPLLDALAVAESRGARRGFLGLLARLGPAIGPKVVARLNERRSCTSPGIRRPPTAPAAPPEFRCASSTNSDPNLIAGAEALPQASPPSMPAR